MPEIVEVETSGEEEDPVLEEEALEEEVEVRPDVITVANLVTLQGIVTTVRRIPKSATNVVSSATLQEIVIRKKLR